MRQAFSSPRHGREEPLQTNYFDEGELLRYLSATFNTQLVAFSSLLMASVPFMPFLRPLPLPRVASIRFLRRSLSHQPAHQEGTHPALPL